jgi:hypothetical protein
MQNYPIWAYNQMAKRLSAPQKKAQNKTSGKLQGVPKFRKLKVLLFVVIDFMILIMT